MQKGTAERPPKSERRGGLRFPVIIPIEAAWQEAGGNRVKESSQATEVNAHGGLLQMKNCPNLGVAVELTNRLSSEVTQARVIGARRSPEGALLGVAVEFLAPNERFWGVNFQLKKTAAELVRLENAIKSATVDPRILTEFRDSVDYVRKTAWVVQEWQERELRSHDPQTLIPLLTSERIRRATQLGKSIADDLAVHQVTRETAGIEEFFGTLETLRQQVAEILQQP
jgi:hypothetical protein